MKRNILFLAFALLSFPLFANLSNLSVRLYNNSELEVVMQGKVYASDRACVINNIKAGNHRIQVYGVGYRTNGIRYTQLMYTGNINILPNKSIEAMVTQNRRLQILSERSIGSGYNNNYNNNYGQNYGGNNWRCNGGGQGRYGGNRHVGINERDYNNLLALIQRESLDFKKMTTAKNIISRNRMSSYQILGILNLFSFDYNKLELAKFAYHYVADPGNYFVVANAFSFDYNAKELNRYIMSN